MSKRLSQESRKVQIRVVIPSGDLVTSMTGEGGHKHQPASEVDPTQISACPTLILVVAGTSTVSTTQR
jgi:hypothetical protein